MILNGKYGQIGIIKISIYIIFYHVYFCTHLQFLINFYVDCLAKKLSIVLLLNMGTDYFVDVVVAYSESSVCFVWYLICSYYVIGVCSFCVQLYYFLYCNDFCQYQPLFFDFFTFITTHNISILICFYSILLIFTIIFHLYFTPFDLIHRHSWIHNNFQQVLANYTFYFAYQHLMSYYFINCQQQNYQYRVYEWEYL